MINELYLKKATNIRKDYISILSNLNAYEKVAQDLSKSIENRMGDAQKLLEKINTGKISNIEVAKDELHKLIINIETNMDDVSKSVDSLNKKIAKLAEDEKKLYREIKQTYTSLSDQEIGVLIHEHFKKLNIDKLPTT